MYICIYILIIINLSIILNIIIKFLVAVRKCETESVESLASSQNFNTDFDENLIMAVMERPALYNHKLNLKERSKLKKSALWEEIKNTLGGKIEYCNLYQILCRDTTYICILNV